MANPSLTEYLAQSQRGLYQSVFGPEFMHIQYHIRTKSLAIIEQPNSFLQCYPKSCLG